MKKQTHINPAPSCMDEHQAQCMTVEQAQQHILQATQPIAESTSCTLKNALGRILSEDLSSPIAVPNHNNSAMDGYAILGSDIPSNGETKLRNVGTAYAGEPYTQTVQAGECVRIMTGATMPTPCDTVVIQERVNVDGEQVTICADEKRGQNVRAAGEDIVAGATILKQGQRLMPAHLGLLASCGIQNVPVWRKPHIVFFSSGNEIISCGQPLSEGQVYDSNRYTLYGMLQRAGVTITDLGIVRDDPQALDKAFHQELATADAIITSGGVSVGEKDYMHDILHRIGKIALWKVAVKPGRPLLFGSIDQSLYFGLPGNPVSVMVVFYIFVYPALRKLMGERPPFTTLRLQARCQSPLRKRRGREEYQRGILQSG